MVQLPSYDQLPPAPNGGRTAWGLFGETDSVGLMNILTPEHARKAASLVRTGASFPLDAPLDLIDPPLFERARLSRDVQKTRGGRGLDETFSGFNPQAASQWDALGHVAYDLDQFYNGATLEDVLERGRNTIGHWAERGIVTRGVLLDLERAAASHGRSYDPGSTHTFSVDDLEEARIAAGVEFEPGDVVVLRSGYLTWYQSQSPEEKVRLSDRQVLTACGIEHTEAMAEYAWNSHAVAFVSDTPSLEVWPMDRSEEAFPFGSIHQVLIALFGMGIGELWWLDDLAAACASDGVYEFMLASTPWHQSNAIGSPANAIAIK
jgi:hypothetical protein